MIEIKVVSVGLGIFEVWFKHHEGYVTISYEFNSVFYDTHSEAIDACEDFYGF
jgi:hypothetical protein